MDEDLTNMIDHLGQHDNVRFIENALTNTLNAAILLSLRWMMNSITKAPVSKSVPNFVCYGRANACLAARMPTANRLLVMCAMKH